MDNLPVDHPYKDTAPTTGALGGEQLIWKNEDGIFPGEIGILTVGDSAGRHIHDGTQHEFHIGGVKLAGIETDGTISTNVVDYEDLVTDDNDIPNKKYLDDAIDALEATAEAIYLKLDASNDPLTGDLEILKSSPSHRLTDSTERDYTEVTKYFADNLAQRANQVGGRGLWTPDSMTTTAWYKADTGVTESSGDVSVWADQSGNGNDATRLAPYQPTYTASDALMNNNPSIGSTDNTSMKGLATPSITVKNAYIVCYYKDGTDSSFDVYSQILGGPGYYGTYRVMGTIGSANWYTTYAFNEESYKDGSTTDTKVGALPAGPSQFKFKSGTARTQVFSIGYAQYYAFTDRDWNGAYSEVIFTDGSEDFDTEQKIEGYLAWKYGMEANLPVDHPYKSAAPTTESTLRLANVWSSDNNETTFGDSTLPTVIEGSTSETIGGRIVNIDRYTANQTLDATNHVVKGNTDGGSFSFTLPAGVSGTEYQITNTGRSGNQLTVSPNGTEQIFRSGAGTSITLSDGEGITIHYEATDDWN